MGWIYNDVFWELMSLAAMLNGVKANCYYSIQFDLSKGGVLWVKLGGSYHKLLISAGLQQTSKDRTFCDMLPRVRNFWWSSSPRSRGVDGELGGLKSTWFKLTIL
jgi:hypothetical protein